MTTLVDAAIRYPGGRTYTGKRHAICIAKAKKTGTHLRRDKFEQGFITDEHKFVNRDEAKAIAILSGQISEDHTGTLYSEDLWPHAAEGEA